MRKLIFLFLPLVVFAGCAAPESSGLAVTPALDMADGAKKIAALAAGGKA